MRLPALILAALFVGRPAITHACASCASADPTLSVFGTELPFAGRLRAAATASIRSEDSGVSRLDEIKSDERRLTLALSWSPRAEWSFGLAVPVVERSAVEVSGRRHHALGVADLELRARFVAFDLRGDTGVDHTLSLHVGADVPVTPLVKSDSVPLPIEAQPSTGAFSGVVGASYALRSSPWALQTSLSGRLSSPGHLDVRYGPVLLANVYSQLELAAEWAVGLGVDGRLDGPASHGDEPDPRSGGVLVVVAPRLLYSPTEDWLLTASLGVPINAGLRGEHREGLAAAIGATCDF